MNSIVIIELSHLKYICKEYFYTNPDKDYSAKDSGLSREAVTDLFAYGEASEADYEGYDSDYYRFH